MFDRPSPALETFEILFFAFISALVLYLLTIFYVTYVSVVQQTNLLLGWPRDRTLNRYERYVNQMFHFILHMIKDIQHQVIILDQ